jgi:hypothetical protein
VNEKNPRQMWPIGLTPAWELQKKKQKTFESAARLDFAQRPVPPLKRRRHSSF